MIMAHIDYTTLQNHLSTNAAELKKKIKVIQR